MRIAFRPNTLMPRSNATKVVISCGRQCCRAAVPALRSECRKAGATSASGLFMTDILDIRLRAKDRLDYVEDRGFLGCLVPTAEFFPDGAVFLDRDAPLAPILVLSSVIRVAADRNEVGAAVHLRLDVPAPIFLAGLDRGNASLDQFRAQPGSQVFPKAARVYEVLFHFREIEAIRLEQDVPMHGLSSTQDDARYAQ